MNALKMFEEGNMILFRLSIPNMRERFAVAEKGNPMGLIWLFDIYDENGRAAQFPHIP